MGQPGLAKMDLVVDHARQNEQAAGVDDFVGGGRRRGVDGGDLTITQQQAGFRDASREDDTTANDESSMRHDSGDEGKEDRSAASPAAAEIDSMQTLPLDHPALAPYRSLRTRNPIAGSGRYIVESEKLVDRLVESGWPIESIVVDRRIEKVPDAWRRRCEQIYRIDDAGELVGFAFHRGALACGIRPTLRPVEIPANGPWRALYMYGVQDPENCGVILRSAAAMGLEHVIFGPHCVDPLARRVIRVSMGSVWKVELFREAASTELLRRCRELDIATLATTPRPDAEVLQRLAVGDRWLLLVGNEAHGLPDELIAGCRYAVQIPMKAGVDSLNVAIATSIVLNRLLYP